MKCAGATQQETQTCDTEDDDNYEEESDSDNEDVDYEEEEEEEEDDSNDEYDEESDYEDEDEEDYEEYICEDEDEVECQSMLLNDNECEEADTVERCKASCGFCAAEEASEAYGVKQQISSWEMMEEWNELQLYMSRIEAGEIDDEIIRDDECRNHQDLCIKWAVDGECDIPAERNHMIAMCSPVCQTCHLESPCTQFIGAEDNRTPALQPGDLNKLFKRIATASDSFDRLQLEGIIKTDEIDNEDGEWVEWMKQYQPNVLGVDPWVVTLDNFVTAEEAKHLIGVGFELGYETSTFHSNGASKNAGVPYRTSKGIFYQWHGDNAAEQIMERIERVVGIPPIYAEDMQLLKYEEGEYYKYHHDYHAGHLQSPIGPRILTFFLYLNDVEEGGETKFEDLDNLTVTPKTGRVVIWPSVLDDDPLEIEGWTFHEAMPVIKGQKFGSNLWYHQYDFQTPHKLGCGEIQT
uniref:Fe2OG dioxygenase domain-containing protein n=1 Tax=Ditylum brightwellii TaxID=49249 RepID=A0A7S2A6H8_9STRA